MNANTVVPTYAPVSTLDHAVSAAQRSDQQPSAAQRGVMVAQPSSPAAPSMHATGAGACSCLPCQAAAHKGRPPLGLTQIRSDQITPRAISSAGPYGAEPCARCAVCARRVCVRARQVRGVCAVCARRAALTLLQHVGHHVAEAAADQAAQQAHEGHDEAPRHDEAVAKARAALVDALPAPIHQPCSHGPPRATHAQA